MNLHRFTLSILIKLYRMVRFVITVMDFNNKTAFLLIFYLLGIVNLSYEIEKVVYIVLIYKF